MWVNESDSRIRIDRKEHRGTLLPERRYRGGSISANCHGSAGELEYHRNLKYLRNPEYGRLTAQVLEVKRMLSSLMQKVRTVN